MRSTGVIGVCAEYLEGDRAREHAGAKALVTHGPSGTQERQSVEGRHFLIFGEALVETTHGLHVGDAALGGARLSHEERLHRGDVPLLLRRGGLRQALLGRRAEPQQDVHRVVPILLGHQWMVVAERLAPVGHGKVRLQLLCRLELLNRLLPAKAVQDSRAAQEVLLGLG